MQKILLFTLCLVFLNTQAQTPQKLNSAEIHDAIKKLNFLGSVLYIAAHPDDENTRLISYYSNEINARTAYLSITRGDGGQNLIGPELKELLGVIRTQELLAARRIDGGNQLFTRAIDFGYTKTPEEALEIWNKEKVLSDVVWAIRKFKPDVVINRFNHRTSGETHGQHTASALLGIEAFDLAGDPTAFPEHLNYTDVFEPKRLFFNTSPWFYGSQKAFDEADKSNLISVDAGVYFPSKGLSNSEIAALSRSEHQSQGFGSSGNRGSQTEYLELLEGEVPNKLSSTFEGIDTSWNRLEGAAEIGEILSNVEDNFNFRDPSESLPGLLEAYQLIQNLKDEHWSEQKSTEIKDIIAACAGLFIEAVAATPGTTALEEVQVQLEAINRSDRDIKLVSVELSPNNSRLRVEKKLTNNETWNNNLTLKIPQNTNYSSPYWLRKEWETGIYEVENQELIGLPETPPVARANFKLNFNGVEIAFDKPVIYKYTDPVKGEVYQPFEILPPVSAKNKEDVVIFANEGEKIVPVTITAGKDNISGEISIQDIPNWQIAPETANFNLEEKGTSTTIDFRVTPPRDQEQAVLQPILRINGDEYSYEITTIDYDHIPLQKLVMPSKTKLVKLDIRKKGENIGYIEGAGDVVPESLEQIGYKVTMIDPAGISASSLRNFDAIVLGIRAYNTIYELKYQQKALFDYVNNGGTLIVQYNTSRGVLVDQIAPYELQLSRDRVTEEDAEVRFLTPAHPLLNFPNKITAKDFEDWVQERGLYFADSWAPEFTPVLSMNDTNENQTNGSLLVANHGKGYFIYTGLSFFRQFPEGVPGAFRLFANMVSIGK